MSLPVSELPDIGWRPETIDRRGFRGRLDARVQAAVAHALTTANLTALADRIALASTSASASKSLHPYVYQFAYWLRQGSAAARRRPEVLQVAETLIESLDAGKRSALGNVDFYGLPIQDQWDPRADLTISKRARANLDEARSADRTFAFNAVSPEQFRPLLADALGLIKSLDPAMFAEITETISIATSFSCENAISFSDVQAYGAIFVCDRFATDVGRLAEILVHEGSHSTLNGIAATSLLFENSANERFLTPLRPDPRPMFGLFHQMFVLARLRDFHTRMPPGFRGVDGTVAEIDRSLRLAIDAVGKHARLTPVGESMLKAVTVSAHDWWS